jgi:hypothetical protein
MEEEFPESWERFPRRGTTLWDKSASWGSRKFPSPQGNALVHKGISGKSNVKKGKRVVLFDAVLGKDSSEFGNFGPLAIWSEPF